MLACINPLSANILYWRETKSKMAAGPDRPGNLPFGLSAARRPHRKFCKRDETGHGVSGGHLANGRTTAGGRSGEFLGKVRTDRERERRTDKKRARDELFFKKKLSGKSGS
jgi:hypothetical protein